MGMTRRCLGDMTMKGGGDAGVKGSRWRQRCRQSCAAQSALSACTARKKEEELGHGEAKGEEEWWAEPRRNRAEPKRGEMGRAHRGDLKLKRDSKSNSN